MATYKCDTCGTVRDFPSKFPTIACIETGPQGPCEGTQRRIVSAEDEIAGKRATYKPEEVDLLINGKVVEPAPLPSSLEDAALRFLLGYAGPTKLRAGMTITVDEVPYKVLREVPAEPGRQEYELERLDEPAKA